MNKEPGCPATSSADEREFQVSRRSNSLVGCAMLVCGILAAGQATGLQTQSKSDDGKPNVSPSIVDVDGQGDTTKPFYRKVEAAFQAARRGDAGPFTRLLAPKADAGVTVWQGSARRTVPMTTATVKAITKNCLGPYAIAEGAAWTQFSFVCRTDADSTLHDTIRFENSPELSMTAFFENGRIAVLHAGEVIMIPGRRLVAMDAYENLSKGR